MTNLQWFIFRVPSQCTYSISGTVLTKLFEGGHFLWQNSKHQISLNKWQPPRNFKIFMAGQSLFLISIEKTERQCCFHFIKSPSQPISKREHGEAWHQGNALWVCLLNLEKHTKKNPKNKKPTIIIINKKEKKGGGKHTKWVMEGYSLVQVRFRQPQRMGRVLIWPGCFSMVAFHL